MYRNLFLMAAVALLGNTAYLHAQDSYGIWYTGCPTKWVNYHNVSPIAEANRLISQLRSNYPSLNFALVPNYNGSRIPPTTNPCGSNGNGPTGGTGGNSGGGSGSNRRTCYGVTFSSNCSYYTLYFDPPAGVRTTRQTRTASSADEVCDWLRRMTNNGWKFAGGSSSNCR